MLFQKSCSTGLSIYHHSLVVLLVLLMDKHLCDTRTMANFRYSLPSSAGASAAYHGISVKCNSTSTNPPTDFLRLKLDFASMALIRHNLIPRPKTLRSTNMTSFFLPSLLIIEKKNSFQLPVACPALPANWWKKTPCITSIQSAWRQFLAPRNPCCWAELAAGTSKIEVGANHGKWRSFFCRNAGLSHVSPRTSADVRMIHFDVPKYVQ